MRIEQRRAARTFENPAIKHNRPDATLMQRAKDGFVYAFSTRSYGAERVNMPVERTKDFTSFTFMGDALPKLPDWALPGTRDVWAPHPVRGNGHVGAKDTYYVFACVPYDPKKLGVTEDGFAIMVATSKSPAGPYVAADKPLIFGPSYAVLDPMVFIDPPTGKPHLLYGSAHEPIRIKELAPDLMSLQGEAQELLAPADKEFERLREGAFLTYRKGHAYPYCLYASGDDTWKVDNYAVTAFVSKSLHGPYIGVGELDPKRGNNVVIHGNAKFERTGHCSVFTDKRGRDFLVYHAVERANPKDPTSGELLRQLMIDRITYDKLGLPRIKNASPAIGPQPAPL